MGIRPISSGEQVVTRDVREELADDLTATAGEVGQPIGEALDEIYATAQSANTSAGEIAARVKALEERKVVETDSAGRIQAADPESPGDVATKRYVDQAVETVVDGIPASTARITPVVLTGTRTSNGWVKFNAPSGVRTTTNAAYPPAGTYIALIETTGAAAISYLRFAKSGEVVDRRVGDLGRTFATLTVTAEHWLQFWVTLSGTDAAAVTVTLLPI